MEIPFREITAYRDVVDFDAFVDFLISCKIIDEGEYRMIWKREKEPRTLKLDRTFETLSKKSGYFEKVLKYLKKNHPTNDHYIEEERSFQDSSIRGGFPKFPPNYVLRNSLAEEVKSKLLGLTWQKKLVIHGMMGYGKSCLVNEVLSSQWVREKFDNCLFWINLGDCHAEADALQPLCRLYTAASSYVDSPIAHCPEIETLKESLKQLFLKKERLRNALIILDDCCNEKVLRYFDIGRKTVVTTQNKNIIRNEDAEFVEVKTGFSLNESMELFKKALGIDGELPPLAEKIHSICQGHPMLIAQIGSYLHQNSDEIIGNRNGSNNEIWKYIEQMLSQGNYRLNEYDEDHIDIPRMIGKCIATLFKNLKPLYEDLAIFPQDVNIPPRVLEILWDKPSHDVRNIMNKFREQSLIVSFYHDNFNTYIYGIHDIHLNYLKEVTKNRIVGIHQKLISGYDRVTNGNYADLPNDNYSFHFIGYHLYHAEMFDRFEVYFDLGFLERKLRAVGKEDVLRDMKKYEPYITRNEENLITKLQQYEDFIDRCGGNLYAFTKTDIIQYALREDKSSHVFLNAYEVAKNSPHLYFQLQKPLEGLDYSLTINIKEDITAACFVDIPQHILIGTADGKIKLFYELIAKEISNFVGHTKAIEGLIVSPDPGKRHFLSVSNDGTVGLWKFAADSSRNSSDYSSQMPASPKTKQSYWCDMHTPDRGQIKPKTVFRSTTVGDHLITAAFYETFPDKFRIVTGSNRGNVTVWDAHNETVLYETGSRGIETPCVVYLQGTPWDKVLFTYDDSVVTFHEQEDKITYYSTLINNETCVGLYAIDDDVLVVSLRHISLWRCSSKVNSCCLAKEKEEIISSTLTNDKIYLVLSTDKGVVYIWNVEEWRLIRKFESRGLAKSLDTFYDEDKSVHVLLMSSDKKTLQQCHIQPFDGEPQIDNLPSFVSYWKKKNALTAIVNNDNNIQIFNGYVQISETDSIKSSKVRCTCFSTNGNCIIYGLENGKVYMFYLKHRRCVVVDNEEKEPIIHLDCYDPNSAFRGNSMGSCGSNDSLDLNEQNSSIIIAVTKKRVIVYKDKCTYYNLVQEANVFHKGNTLYIIDRNCRFYVWRLDTNTFEGLPNRNVLEPVKILRTTFCSHQLLVAAFFKQNGSYFLDVYEMRTEAKLVTRIDMAEEVMSMCFSFDGSLLAVGLKSGDVKVKNLRSNKSTVLHLHNYPVERLYFSRNMEPILISLGEVIGFWNLKDFQAPRERKAIKPTRIDISSDLWMQDLENMNISYWTGRRALESTEYLISCIKLHGKAKFISASNDFNSFLTVDDKGKVYIMETV